MQLELTIMNYWLKNIKKRLNKAKYKCTFIIIFYFLVFIIALI